MKMKATRNNILPIVVCLLVLFPFTAKAQYGFDVASIEAYINDHKQQRSLLLVRSTLEASNKLLHEYSSDANIGFRDINKELDRYTRAFDVIDILYQSLRTSLNIYNTYENISDRVGDYKNMLEDFRKKCLDRGNIVSTDTLIITVNAGALAKIAEEGDNLYRSVSDLILYATGAAACSTADLYLILMNINNSLDNIRTHLNRAYFETWRYIQVRIGYWKRQVYRAKTKEEMYADIYDDAMWLINLVENLLSVSRLEGGRMNPHVSTELMDEVVAEALRHINRKSAEYYLKVHSNEEYLLAQIDAKLIVQVIINIVDNAIKYTPPGSEIDIRWQQKGSYIYISIADNGPGISDKDKPHIFDMFYSASNQIVDSRRSMGLGLALCKSIVNAHGEEIMVTDHLPHGAIFTFSVPAGEVELHE